MATVVSELPVTQVPQTAWPDGSTLADLQSHLGGIPLNRILVNPPLGLATEGDVAQSQARYGKLCELVDGVLVEKPVGFYESSIAGIIFAIIRDHVTKHKLGLVSGESGPLRLLPGKVRMPDVSFIGWDRFPDRKPPRAQVMPVAPELAVEVLSPSNTKAEMDRKLKEYFDADVRLVWYIDPLERSATAYTVVDKFETIHEGGELVGDPVLPGLRIDLGKVFAEAFQEPPAERHE